MLSSCFSYSYPPSLILWGFTSDVSKNHMEVWGVFGLISLLVPLPYFSQFNSCLSSFKYFPMASGKGVEFKKRLTNLMTATATQKSCNFPPLWSLLFPLLIFTSFPSLCWHTYSDPMLSVSRWHQARKSYTCTVTSSPVWPEAIPSDIIGFPGISSKPIFRDFRLLYSP